MEERILFLLLLYVLPGFCVMMFHCTEEWARIKKQASDEGYPEKFVVVGVAITIWFLWPVFLIIDPFYESSKNADKYKR